MVVDTSPVVPTGQTIAVPAGGDVQAALDAAQPGDVVTLEAGATFRGPFVLPTKTGEGWITVRTSAPDGSLPPPGTRVTPAHAAAMPKLVVGEGVGGAVQTAPGAHHYRLIGVEILPVSGAWVSTLVELGSAEAVSEAGQPNDIVIDRCYVHGNPGEAARRGIALNGRALAVIDSHLSEFKDDFLDTQALMGWNGSGPIKIANNYLEATGENVMFGGGDPLIAGLVPSDIEIRRNHFVKPVRWRDAWAGVKNLFELKNARRVLVEGNVFENSWLAAQAGFAVLLTVRNQDGTAPWSVVEDVTFRRNIVRHAGSAVQLLGTDGLNPSETMRRVLIRDNLFQDISALAWGGTGRLFQISDSATGIADLVIEHNTAVQEGPVIFATQGVAHSNFVYRDNLSPRGDFGVFGDGLQEGLVTLDTYFPGADFRGNVLAGANPAIYPAGNFFPASLEAVGFVDLAAGDYRLSAASPYRNAATDGTDVGADIGALGAATAGVVAEPLDALPPTVAVTSPADATTVSGTITVSAGASDAIGVVQVRFKLGGADLGAPVTSPPYSVSWNTSAAAVGSHVLVALAFDDAGNVGVSAPVSVTVGRPPANLDVDGNGTAEATDGQIILRYLSGYPDSQLLSGVTLGSGATRTTPAAIRAYLDASKTESPAMLDPDGNGAYGGMTDGRLIYRYLSGVRGAALVAGSVIGAGATRTTADSIAAYLDGFMPQAATGP